MERCSTYNGGLVSKFGGGVWNGNNSPEGVLAFNSKKYLHRFGEGVVSVVVFPPRNNLILYLHARVV